VLGGQEPSEVLEAMEVLAGVFLDALAPDDTSASVLQRIGLLAACGGAA
jgi:hypothetical protein